MMMSHATHTILIAEDNEVTSRVLKFNLERGGYEVFVALDGQEAWEFLAERTADLLITDFQMPRLCGLELIALVRQNPRLDAMPIFLCSAKGLELDLDLLKAKYQVEQVFFKPFSPKAIIAATHSLFEQESASV
jgi:CheY-like chemotaxis protein